MVGPGDGSPPSPGLADAAEAVAAATKPIGDCKARHQPRHWRQPGDVSAAGYTDFPTYSVDASRSQEAK